MPAPRRNISPRSNIPPSSGRSLFGLIFFAEPVRPLTVIGAAMIVVACCIAARRTPRADRRRRGRRSSRPSTLIVKARMPRLKTKAARQWQVTTLRMRLVADVHVGGLEGHAEREGEIDEVGIAGRLLARKVDAALAAVAIAYGRNGARRPCWRTARRAAGCRRSAPWSSSPGSRRRSSPPRPPPGWRPRRCAVITSSIARLASFAAACCAHRRRIVDPEQGQAGEQEDQSGESKPSMKPLAAGLAQRIVREMRDGDRRPPAPRRPAAP